KPSNVVLRHGKEAVLVDFGLAGRHVRPGCATGPYGAPEVWSGEGSAAKTLPAKADVYAFGCAAYEALTGKPLFAADSELVLITKHLAHDGFPEPLKALARREELLPVAELLFSTLRRDPANRPAVPAIRAELRRLAPGLARLRWPLAGP
ncbi:MAG TPA: serine/threonine protein kinase, partial [Polyangiaceae bacterium]